MGDLFYAGAGYPNGPVDNARIFALPSPKILMLITEARYHHDEAVEAGKTVLWRAIPNLGKRPAELGWSPRRFLDEALNETDRPTHPITDFVFANELDLQDERGDDEDDWSNLENRYGLLGGWGYSLIPMLRQALPGTRLHWPAFTPDHQALGYAYLWQEAARRCDVIDFHAYDSLENIERQYLDYRRVFPEMPLALTEWHCTGNLQEEERVLRWLAETRASDPLFDAAYFFIWRWDNHPGWYDNAWSIEGDPDRERLFLSPPVFSGAPPGDPPMFEYPLGIDVSNNNGAVDWAAVAASGVSFAVAKSSEGRSFVDAYFAANMAGMAENGLVRGSYHFILPQLNAPEDEVAHYLDVVEGVGLQVGDFLAIDVEEHPAYGPLPANTGAWLAAMVQMIRDQVGFLPLIYTRTDIARQFRFFDDPILGECGLWLASWGVPTPPPAPLPWDLVAIHQTGVGPAGTIAGVGDVDLNRFNGPDVATLKLYGKPADGEPSVPEEPPTSTYAVGSGILAKMQEQGDTPATDEVYHGEQFSEAYGASGSHYVYLKVVNRTFVTRPTA